ncbi:RNA polymerase sigma-70 factor [Chitinophaga defluvii]|uniref:RNA polymerase sigma-70 factor n=1 Tax=Chitinophaga defluvii TaxID=3163343 RepID=A0ABV2TAN9_9BACT
MAQSPDYMALDDGQLVGFWQTGDEEAFKALYKKYFPRLYDLAIQKVDDILEVEELVQDVFVSFWKQRDALIKTDISGYLFISLRNRIFSHYRKRLSAKHRIKLVDVGFHEPIVHDDGLKLESKELSAVLNNYIEKLPPQCKTVFTLSRKQQLTNKEIADQLNISVRSVEQHITKALRVLREAVNEHKLTLTISAMAVTQLLGTYI